MTAPARRRVTLFAKGNVDVRDTLLFSRVNGETVWNGVNVALRDAGYRVTARVQHEVATRFDQILACPQPIPADLAARGLPLDTYSLEAQYTTRLFDSDADAFVLSVQTAFASKLLRHKTHGYLLFPHAAETWSDDDRAWARANFDRLPPPSPEEAMAQLEQIVRRLQRERERPVLVFNMSSVSPAERIHRYYRAPESITTRIRRLNLALVDLATRAPFSIVDVDDIVARGGASVLKLDTFHLEPAGYRAIAEAVVRILADYGLLS